MEKPNWLYIPEWLSTDIWHFPYAYKTFGKYIPKEGRVLEVGFGSGRMLTRIAGELDCKCTGVDVEDGPSHHSPSSPGSTGLRLG